MLQELQQKLSNDFLKIADETLQFGDTTLSCVINRGTVKFRDVAVLCSQDNQTVAEIWVLNSTGTPLQRGDVLSNSSESFKLIERVENIDQQIEHWIAVLTSDLKLGEKLK